MAFPVIMPALGMGQETGTLVRWLKREGESVVQGEPLMEVETDKVVVEIEAPGSGVLAQLTAAEGETVPVGQVIAVILAPGEAIPLSRPATAAPSGPASPAEGRGEVSAPPPPLRGRAGEGGEAPAPLPLGEAGRRPAGRRSGEGGHPLPASPRARRLAAEQGADLTAVRGTGPAGAIVAADVLSTPSPQPSPRGRGGTAAPEPTLGVSRVWAVMAQRMTASWTSAPHFFLTREVAAGPLQEARERLAAAALPQQGKEPPTHTDLLVKLVATALRHHPRLNARWVEGRIQSNPEIHMGIATATEEALLVPVIHHADRLTVAEIAARRKDLVERASAGQLRPADVAGATFTITNLGMYGVDAFCAILNPPQAAILAVGRIADRVVAVDGQPTVRPTVILTLSCDHRVVDGARAAQFLDGLVGLIQEAPGLLA